MELARFHQKRRVKNFDVFERDEADTYLWGAGLLINGHMLHYEQVFGNVF